MVDHGVLRVFQACECMTASEVSSKVRTHQTLCMDVCPSAVAAAPEQFPPQNPECPAAVVGAVASEIVSTHYEVLGVAPSATARQIKEAFHRLARQFHPDREVAVGTSRTASTHTDSPCDGNVDSLAPFHRIQQAWECLQDPRLRQEYDQSLWIQLRQTRRHRGAISLTVDDCRWEPADLDKDDADTKQCQASEPAERRDNTDVEQERLHGDDRNVEPSLVLLFTCRCGEELLVLEDSDDDGFMECLGCSLVYDTKELQLVRNAVNYRLDILDVK